MKNIIAVVTVLLFAPLAIPAATTAPQWQEVEFTFTATREMANPYTDTEAWADFTHDDGTTIRRPMFWDGGRTFRVRFASTKASGAWRWTTSDRDGDPGLNGKSGTLAAGPATSERATIFTRHGFWSIPPGGRNLVHADGRPRLLCADTAWALPWRATEEQAEIYARDRQAKGFNAALLMTVQPDMDCKGPRSRTEDLGFDVGFEDLPKGTHSRRHAPPRYAWADPRYDVAQSSMVPCHRDLLAALRGEAKGETTGADNLKTLELVFGAYDSAKKDAVVKF